MKVNGSVSFMEDVHSKLKDIGSIPVVGAVISLGQASTSLLQTVTALAIMILLSPFYLVSACVNKGSFCKGTKEVWSVAMSHLIMGITNFEGSFVNMFSLGFYYCYMMYETNRLQQYEIDQLERAVQRQAAFNRTLEEGTAVLGQLDETRARLEQMSASWGS